MSNNQIRAVATKLSHSIRFRKIILLLIAAVVVLGLVITPVEKNMVGSKFKTTGDGLWFAVTTVTGVGYGDVVPVSALGRMLAVILQVFGVALFGSVMAFVSVELLRYQEDFNMKRVLSRLDEQEVKLNEIKKHLDFLVKK